MKPPLPPKKFFRDNNRSGLSAAEVVVLLVLVLTTAFLLIALLPRQREAARASACRQNLMRIGVGLSLYDNLQNALPSIPSLPAAPGTGGPLATLLETLALPDLTALSDPLKPPPPLAGAIPRGIPVPGFTCPSDPPVRALAAPTSYRATTGDNAAGEHGGFQPGRSCRLTEIEAGDGLSFTAAFSERLLGRPPAGDGSRGSYATTRVRPGDLVCQDLEDADWHSDAGSPWGEAGWRSTLYNHVLVPDSLRSCIDTTGKNALMGASSGHKAGPNVLLFDGSVRTVTPGIDLRVWMSQATIRSGGPSPDILEPRK